MKQEDKIKIHAYIDAHRNELISTLQELIRIPSVKTEATQNAPFGQECADALKYTLDKSEELGFSSKNLENYIGYCEAGEGEECFGILVHLDVVPVSEGWDQPPFSANIVDNEMYGRGSCDDKGPAIAALYALAAVSSLNKPFKKRVRLIYGCDEESGWKDIDYYREHDVMPDIAISPDAEYPIINSEKGIAHLEMNARFDSSKPAACVLSISGGTRPNVVPADAFASVCGVPADTIRENAKKLEAKYALTIEVQENAEGCTIHIVGLASHAMDPQKGKNAVTAMLELISALPLDDSEAHDALHRLTKAFPFDDYNGNNAGIACNDSISGPLTANLGLIDFKPDSLSATVDIRYPVSSNGEMIRRILSDEIALEVTNGHCQGPHFVSPKSDLVKALIKVYEDETDFKGECLSIGGGTYARSIENAVSFGCQFPGRPDLAHQANERVDLDELILNAKIIASTIAEICL